MSGWEQIFRKLPKIALHTGCIPTLPTSTGTQPKRDEVGSVCIEFSIGLVGCIEVFLYTYKSVIPLKQCFKYSRDLNLEL